MPSSTLQVYRLPALSDNYIFILVDGRQVSVVDAGDAGGVLDFLQTDNTIEEVIFVCFDDATYDIYLKLLEDNY